MYLINMMMTFSAQNCSTVDCWKLQCNVGLLEKGTTAILKVRSRVWAETFTEVCGRRTFAMQTPQTLSVHLHVFQT